MSFRTPETFRTPELPTSRVSTARRGSDRTARSVTVREEEFDDFFLLDQTFDNPEEYIKRFLEIGDYESAVYWIDNVYSKGNEREAHRDPIKFAKYIKLLVSAQQWLRVSSTLESGDKFHTRHVLFAYFYVRSLFERKMYTQVASAQIGHLIDVANTPIRPAVVINGVEVYLTGYEAPITSEQRRELDAMAEKLAVRSAILLVLGQTFIVLENRQAAAKCLKRALVKDPCCLKAEQLLLQYKLLEVRDEQALHELSSKREPETSEKDPRILTERAKTHYARGDPKAAIQITTDILRHFGWYKVCVHFLLRLQKVWDCLIVHINSLSLLEDSDALFTFSHHIVDAMPECEIAWYSVALYYLACKNKAQAKAFMNKSTVMTPGFGDGWLALGHILASDSDNDQALSCYYRAARIMEKNFEPSLYIAMQCSKSGVKLAKSFLEDAARLAPQNPIIYQEQACLAYNDKGFRVALQLYEKALKLVIVGEDLNKLKDLTLDPHEYIARKMYPSDVFWAPLLNNLGHCCRRLQLLEKAKIYHQAALLLQPNNPQALCSSSMVLFAAGDNCGAVQQINKALSIQPFDEIIRENNDLIMNLSTKYNRPKIDRVDGELISPDEFEDLFKTAMLTRPKTPLRFHNQKATRILDEANQILRKPKSFAPVMTPPQVTRVYGRSVRGLPPLPQLGNTPRNPEMLRLFIFLVVITVVVASNLCPAGGPDCLESFEKTLHYVKRSALRTVPKVLESLPHHDNKFLPHHSKRSHHGNEDGHVHKRQMIKALPHHDYKNLKKVYDPMTDGGSLPHHDKKVRASADQKIDRSLPHHDWIQKWYLHANDKPHQH